MRHWHRQFLGRTQLPPTLSALAISECFTLNSGEASSVLTRYGLDMRLGTALQIGFIKTCGRPLDKLQRIPLAVLEYLSPQLGGAPPEIATLRAIYGQRRKTLYDHQQFALDTLGMTHVSISPPTHPVFWTHSAVKCVTATRAIIDERRARALFASR